MIFGKKVLLYLIYVILWGGHRNDIIATPRETKQTWKQETNGDIDHF